MKENKYDIDGHGGDSSSSSSSSSSSKSSKSPSLRSNDSLSPRQQECLASTVGSVTTTTAVLAAHAHNYTDNDDDDDAELLGLTAKRRKGALRVWLRHHKRTVMVVLVALSALLQAAGFQLVNDLCRSMLGDQAILSSLSSSSVDGFQLPRLRPALAAAPSSQLGWTALRVQLTFESTIAGVFVAAIPAGYIAWRHGFRTALAVAVPVNLLLTSISPALVDYHPAALMVPRGLAGAALALSFVAWFSLASLWIPAQERTRALAAFFAGSYLGPALALPYRLAVPAYGWWPAFGGLALSAVVWLAAWLALSESSVSSASVKERRLIFDTVTTARTRHRQRVVQCGVPWRRLLLHRGVWALCAANLCFSSTLYIFTETVPAFMQHYGLNPHPLLVDTLPFPVLAAVALGGAWLADWLIGRKHYSQTAVRMAMQVVALTVPTAILVLVAQVAFDPVEFASLVMVAVGLLGLNIPGLFTCVLDAVPDYAALTYGLMLWVACVPQIGCYYFYPYLHQRFQAWVAPMAAAGIINLLGTIFWILCAVNVPIDSNWTHH